MNQRSNNQAARRPRWFAVLLSNVVLTVACFGAQTLICQAMGETHRLAERVNLAMMTPYGELASSGYCLADPAKEYLVYLPAGGEAILDLSAATGQFQVEWIHPTESKATPAAAVTGGAKRTLQAPLSGEAIAHPLSPNPDLP